MKTWRGEDDEILIDFVRNHEAIYNIKSKDHRKTHLKQNLWREIGKILNRTDYDCSKRWCYVRDYYIRRRGKITTGTSGEAAKKRADLLSFLDGFPTQKSSTNIGDEYPGQDWSAMEDSRDNSEEAVNPGQANINIITEIMHDNNEEMQFYPQETEEIYDEDDNTEGDGNNDPNITSDVERKKMVSNVSRKKRKNTNAQEQSNTQNELDENELFFSAMAKIVKKLPRFEQAKLRLQIGSLVGNAELRHIANDSSSTIASPRLPLYQNSLSADRNGSWIDIKTDPLDS